jgi:pimeloyl-ACP methyl ester carboxylesterase
METFSYSSSADGLKPLYADIAFKADGVRKPLIAVMHGYNGSRKNVTQDLTDLAAQGVVALAPDMRGCGNSAGQFDSGGLDVYDIADAVLAAVARFPGEIDARNINVIGYSGGGGNAIACAVRFPDLFRTVASFFGISDYAAWHRSKGRPDCNERMEKALGGSPDAQPDLYAARNANDAAANVQAAALHLFWDEEEADCPPAMIEQFVANYGAAGLKRLMVHLSRRGEPRRWLHGYRTDHPSLRAADAIFLRDVLAPGAQPPRLAPQGQFTVNGYLVTRHFAVWIEDGQRGQVTVSYDLNAAQPVVKVLHNPKNLDVKIKLETPLAKLP